MPTKSASSSCSAGAQSLELDLRLGERDTSAAKQLGGVVIMGRRSHSQTLHLWANGDYVGRWTVKANRDSELAYDASWRSADAWPPHLAVVALPMDNEPLKGPVYRTTSMACCRTATSFENVSRPGLRQAPSTPSTCSRPLAGTASAPCSFCQKVLNPRALPRLKASPSTRMPSSGTCLKWLTWSGTAHPRTPTTTSGFRWPVRKRRTPSCGGTENG